MTPLWRSDRPSPGLVISLSDAYLGKAGPCGRLAVPAMHSQGWTMAPNDTRAWMWAEACELLDRAERLNRQFFQPLSTRKAVWEPPVDLFETDRALWVVVALPGV